MKTKMIAVYDAFDEFFEQLSDEYQNLDFDSFVARVKTLHPEIIRDEEADEIEGEIQNENERYILTWEDGMDECVRIYEKVSDNTKTYYAFMWGEGTIEEVELTPEEFAEMKTDEYSIFETREEAERFAKGE